MFVTGQAQLSNEKSTISKYWPLSARPQRCITCKNGTRTLDWRAGFGKTKSWKMPSCIWIPTILTTSQHKLKSHRSPMSLCFTFNKTWQVWLQRTVVCAGFMFHLVSRSLLSKALFHGLSAYHEGNKRVYCKIIVKKYLRASEKRHAMWEVNHESWTSCVKYIET